MIMITEQEALQLIQDSYQSLTRSGVIQLEEQIEITEEIVLMGSGALLDSMGFVTLVTDIEDRMEQKTGHECYIELNEINDFDINSPNLTIGVLVQYLITLA
jgi:hypothetical protein